MKVSRIQATRRLGLSHFPRVIVDQVLEVDAKKGFIVNTTKLIRLLSLRADLKGAQEPENLREHLTGMLFKDGEE